MARAHDRVKNTDNRSEVFIRTDYWTNEVEDAFEAWLKKYGKSTLEERIALHLESEVAVSFKALDSSVCCTLAHQPNRDALLPYLLTGWSDDPFSALQVAEYKLDVMLKGVWEAPPARPAPKRR